MRGGGASRWKEERERERENEGGKERSGHERAGATMDCCKGGGGGGGRTLSRSLKLDGGNSGNNVPRRGKGGICQFALMQFQPGSDFDACGGSLA